MTSNYPLPPNSPRRPRGSAPYGAGYGPGVGPGYGPGYGAPPPQRRGGGRLAPPASQYALTAKQKRASGFRFAFGFLAVIWGVFIVNEVFFLGALKAFGVHPLDANTLLLIFTSPLLHANVSHIISNSIPGAIFCFLIGYSGARVFWEVTGIVTVIAGLGTWVFGGIGTNHIGASGLIYGWLAYLVVRGFFNRSAQQIALGVILGFFYSGLIWGVLPGTEGVSWQGHLFGAIGGIVAGMAITSDDPPELRERRARRQTGRGPRYA
ncbi:rhomboid family intramembrane serine protease [Corynebacterium liangguodongii]|uniref:Rhomboid family intramembrane serine protease n=1 Tax=Corynebacterium liangguodongii TaxID=2079535 RepID=A0A2S0WFL6_9CORY|nr:rhomboid family intramembrane serine protease [Corynebacterium liangguodongii]AWB84577.1 rhomboid family intramembrane serine protease [Corynebacterium liangguodongii]PWB98838.1 rhomboid family intramembrane serine protease [Corynebacterium liangguodongii]